MNSNKQKGKKEMNVKCGIRDVSSKKLNRMEWNGNCHWGRVKTAKFSNWCTSPRVRLHRRRRRRRIRANWLLSCHDTKLNKRDYKPQLDGAYKHWLTSHQRNHFDSIETEMHLQLYAMAHAEEENEMLEIDAADFSAISMKVWKLIK